MREDERRAVEAVVGCAVASTRGVTGGAINEAFEATLEDGRAVFVKTNVTADRRMFPVEARGLAWLRTAEAVRVPRVLGVTAPDADGPPVLVLELIVSSARSPDFDERLGRGLARLHAAGAQGFGLDHDNFVGSLPQVNHPAGTWHEFYALRRLEPMVARAVDSGRAPRTWIRRFERLYRRMADLTGPAEPPARLHGDLWSGNVMSDERGRPCLVDPAVYGGHREIDLAMLVLFGSPSARFFTSYDEVWPRGPGAADRVALYQLYPLLVHVNLFGGGYASAVEAALERYV